jgi:predicted RNA-binding protein YlqC (UPF0109 family)
VEEQNRELPFSPLKSGMGRDLSIEELLRGIIIALVDERNEVEITCMEKVSSTVFQVKVAPTDVGKIIGKDGRTATSIRGVLSAMGIAAKMRYGLDIVTKR